jgi:phosphohistidine swiveling domain-containing protein
MKPKQLTNIFSREKSLIYFCVWDDSDAASVRLIGRSVHTRLFLVPPPGSKGSVWYERTELERIKHAFRRLLSSRQGRTLARILQVSRESWEFLRPYATRRVRISSPEEFSRYYDRLVRFWIGLNSYLFEVLDDPGVDPSVRRKFDSFRNSTERYTETMSALITEYIERFRDLRRIAYVVTRDEAVDGMRGALSSRRRSAIERRLRGCAMLNGRVLPLAALEGQLHRSGLALERADLNVRELRGTSAYRGIVRGRVVVVHGFQDIRRVRRGDILVTQMTNPEYVPAIRRSAGFVTDEGGMLCHAAIVARELRKPCIISTKAATQILKDGDRVEVDATKGIVRKLPQ